ncbi:MAG: TIGR01212 family radical SAM protein, partial [Erysipelotrichaceae bacterium]|nr:TIGR01212 family radical SAM protein [Erysipelotrichaceae bacterium]
HLILGLPGETEEMMLESVRYVNRLKPSGIKLHLLQILKGTAMAEQFKRDSWPIMSLEEYCSLVIKCLDTLSEDIVIHRLSGDGPKSLLIEPAWCSDKKHVLNTLNRMVAQAERTKL